jgi:hypothetical protein
VPPDTQRAALGPGPGRLNRAGPGTRRAPDALVIWALVPFPAVTLPGRCGRSMRFVGEVQLPSRPAGLTGGRGSW